MGGHAAWPVLVFTGCTQRTTSSRQGHRHCSCLHDLGSRPYRHRCIVRIIGLGFQAGEAENSIVNDSLFMAQVTPRPRGPAAQRQRAC